MRIRLIAIGNKMPAWVIAGMQEYLKRLPAYCSCTLIEIPAEKRDKNSDLKKLTAREGEKIVSVLDTKHHVIALDVKGKSWSTEVLSQNVARWLHDGRNIDLLIGGPDGLAPVCLQKAETVWSLSPLTFPHPLVRIIVAEQLYRAVSILQGHPYHK